MPTDKENSTTKKNTAPKATELSAKESLTLSFLQNPSYTTKDGFTSFKTEAIKDLVKELKS